MCEEIVDKDDKIYYGSKKDNASPTTHSINVTFYCKKSDERWSYKLSRGLLSGESKLATVRQFLEGISFTVNKMKLNPEFRFLDSKRIKISIQEEHSICAKDLFKYQDGNYNVDISC